MNFRTRLAAAMLLGAFCGLQSCGLVRWGIELADTPAGQKAIQALLDKNTTRQEKIAAGLDLARAGLDNERKAREASDADTDTALMVMGGTALAGAAGGGEVLRRRLGRSTQEKAQNFAVLEMLKEAWLGGTTPKQPGT